MSERALALNEQPTLLVSQSTVMTPMEMLDRALSSGASLDMVEKLMALQERWEANTARKAFNEAFSAFKSEAVKVIRNREVADGPLKGRKYAELSSFIEAATPALSKHGLSSSWAITRDEKDWIEVTCTIEHVMGGRKQVAQGGPPDAGGAKNALQARISTVTYLERSTFKAACGLAEQGDDDDGGTAGADDLIDEQQADWLKTSIVEVGADLPRFLAFFKINSVNDLPVKRLAEANDMLARKRADDKKKASANAG